MKKTTVIIPNYNGMEYLDNCLRSLQMLQGPPFDIIVVDNGSGDDSVALVKEKFPEVRLIAYERNRGFCRAVNIGIRMATTPYVFLLNNDTEVEEGCIEVLEIFLDTYPKYFSAASKMLSLREPTKVDDAGDLYCALGWAFAIGKDKAASKYDKNKQIFAACAGATMYRRKVFEEIGLFDVNHFAYLEDIDIGYRARLHGYRNAFCKDAVVYHAGSGFSGSRYNRFKINLSARNNVYLIYKNMPFLQRLLNFPFFCLGFGIKFLFFCRKGYGLIYVRGLLKGWILSKSERGKRKKVKFRLKNSGNYILVQAELWWNLLRVVFR